MNRKPPARHLAAAVTFQQPAGIPPSRLKAGAELRAGWRVLERVEEVASDE